MPSPLDRLSNHRFSLLLVALSLLILAHPVAERWADARLAFHIAFGVVLLASLFAVRRSKVGLTFGIVLGIPAFLSFWVVLALPHVGFLGSADFGAFRYYIMGAFLVVVVVFVLQSVFRGRQVTTDRLCGALCVFLLLGLVWGFTYAAIETQIPESFRFADGLLPAVADENYQYSRSSVLFYYSFVTLTTLGFGDVTPLTPAARTLTMWEAIVGQAYLTILVARLVGLHITSGVESSRAEAHGPSQERGRS